MAGPGTCPRAVPGIPMALSSQTRLWIPSLRPAFRQMPRRPGPARVVPVHMIASLERPAPSSPGWHPPPPPRFPPPSPAYPNGKRVLRDPQPQLAHELIQGDAARFAAAHGGRAPPTLVLVHGILGSRRNLLSLAKRLLAGNPAWQVLLVDLRCHGESAPLSRALQAPHTLASAAGDVLRLLSALRLFPEVLVGHSYGAKVVMAMSQQFAARTGHGGRLPRPVQVWALDALPGRLADHEDGVDAGHPDLARRSRVDHPADLIAALRAMPLPLRSRAEAVAALRGAGFSAPVAAWAGSALRPLSSSDPGGPLVWAHDLEGIASMYASYRTTCLWDFVRAPVQGLELNFVRAERSAFHWSAGDVARIRAAGHAVHDLPDSGHWVHVDNPEGLLAILQPALRRATPPALLVGSGSEPAGAPAQQPPQQPPHQPPLANIVARPAPGPAASPLADQALSFP
ncbi:hypothetical protein ACKKBG_A30180 [Auxenochlorella protothecoides x Auxenochlorella symbiontica]